MKRLDHELELCGFQEVCELLNIDKRILSVYVKRGKIILPEPYQELGATKIWRKDEIIAMMQN